MEAPVLGRSALSGRIPVSVVTGFLGSGKTTLVNKLLKRPEMNRVAVIVNELGEQAIDNDLVEVSSEQMMLLNNGCLCCVLRGDLQETMRDLFIKRRNGVIIDFDRLVIETTVGKFSMLRDAIQKVHSYKVPEIIALSVSGGSLPYLEWVRSETR